MRTLLLLVLFFTIHIGYCQVDREFWFAAPEVDASHQDRPVYLRMASMLQDAEVIVTMPANPLFGIKRFNIPAGQSRTYTFTNREINMLENFRANSVQNKGLHITSTEDITAYYEVEGRNTDIFVLKGTNALGTKFIMPFQNFTYNHSGGARYASFDIVATEDSTLVEITPTNDIVGHRKGIPFTILLDKGQTYSARALSWQFQYRLTGSKITSNKKVAVTLKDDSNVSTGLSGPHDLVGDQIIPSEKAGLEYVVMKGFLSRGLESVMILATEDSTNVTYTGANIGGASLLQEGKSSTIRFASGSNSIHIVADKPIYVFHVSGFGREMGGALIPSIRCTGSKVVPFVRSNFESFFLTVLAKAGSQGDFVLNGRTDLIRAADFNPVPGTGGQWLLAQKSFSPSVIRPGQGNLLVNNKADFHLGLFHGRSSGSGCRYGYFSDFGALDLGVEIDACIGDTVVLNAGFGKDSYLWNTGDTTQVIKVLNDGRFDVYVTKGGCDARDTVDVKFNPNVIMKLNVDSAEICRDSLFFLTGGVHTRYKWNGVTGDSTLKPTRTGNYILEAFNEFGCSVKDTAYVVINNNPISRLIRDLYKCDGETETILGGTDPSASYTWHDNSTSRSYSVSTEEQISVKIQGLNGCITKDTIQAYYFRVPPAPIVSTQSPYYCENSLVKFDPKPVSGGKIEYYFTTNRWRKVDLNSLWYRDSGRYEIYAYQYYDTAICLSPPTAVPIIIKPNPRLTPAAFDDCLNEKAAITDIIIDGRNLPALTHIASRIDGSNGFFIDSIDLSGTYKFKKISLDGCADSLNKQIVLIPKLELFNDSTICYHDEIKLYNLSNDLGAFKLNNDLEGDTFVLDKAGVYNISLTYNNCTASKAYTLSHFQYPDLIKERDSLCDKWTDTADLSIMGDYEYYSWDDFGVESKDIVLGETGVFSVSVEDINGCLYFDTLVVDNFCEPVISVPNVLNLSSNIFENSALIFKGKDIEEFEFRLFNRWGQIVYSTNNFYDSWYAKFKGQNVPSGVYNYEVKYSGSNITKSENGSIMVVY